MEGDDMDGEITEEAQEETTNDDNEETQLSLIQETIQHEEEQTEATDESNEIENTDESTSLFTDPEKSDTLAKVSKSRLFNIATDKKHFEGDSVDIHNSASSHAYHFKRKYNFRSDSVFSDVTPMPTSSSDSSKSSEAREKCGSLSSLKSRESRWVSLRRKLGKVTSPSTPKKPESSSTEKTPGTLAEKRSLLQRAKTLSILPVNRGPPKEESPKVKEQPPELFNVGGEMNMIPLELLIDISDLQLRK